MMKRSLKYLAVMALGLGLPALSCAETVEIEKREVRLTLESDGLFLINTINGKKTAAGPFSFNDTIPEPYGLKLKLSNLIKKGSNVRGSSAVMIDYSGEEISFMKRYVDIKDKKSDNPGTFFYEGELQGFLSSDSSFSIMQHGNEGLPQVNFRIIEPKNKTTFFDAQAASDDLEQIIKGLKDRSIVKLGAIKPKRGGEDLKVYAVRFASKQTYFKLFELLDALLMGKEYSRERVSEVKEVVNDLKMVIGTPSYEHYIAINVEDDASAKRSRNWVKNVSIFTNKKAVRYRPGPAPVAN